MGQGTESCGGYDVEYDPWIDAPDGYWIQANGERIHVTKMALSHMQNARRMAERKAETATFSDDAERWNDWVNIFDDEIHNRRNEVATVSAQGQNGNGKASSVTLTNPVIGAIQALAQAAGLTVTVQINQSQTLGHVQTVARPPIAHVKPVVRGDKAAMICHCGQRYDARTADIKRGWALSCSKRCAAIRRDFGRPAAKRAT